METNKRAITVNELKEVIDILLLENEEMGKRRILLPDDEECNGLHKLVYGFTKPDGILKPGTINLPNGLTGEDVANDYIILG